MASSFVFAAVTAAVATLLGGGDLENYVHSFVSLDRGSAMPLVRVLWIPVYTLALGFGVRLPMHGSLAASPAALAAPFVSEPITYWLLLTVAIGAATIISRHALEPVCGPGLSWAAAALLFWSVPLVGYTLVNDWPETALTYCAIVGCVYAPHAMLALGDTVPTARWPRFTPLSVPALVFGLIGASHPGYWPMLAVTLVVGALLALTRSAFPLSRRLWTTVGLAVAAALAVAVQAPDLLREVRVADATGAPMIRLVQGPARDLLPANLFPLVDPDHRLPFTFLILAIASLIIGVLSRPGDLRRLAIGGSLLSVAFALLTAFLPTSTAFYAPSTIWAFRDPALVFAVLGGACAAHAVLTGSVRRIRGGLPVLLLLLFAALQGPLYVAWLGALHSSATSWSGLRDGRMAPHNAASPVARAASRGLPGSEWERVALWPGVIGQMRNKRDANTDFADAGYMLVTATTKQRTMRSVVEPNAALFNQSTELSSAILCSAAAVEFLQLRYLLSPQAACGPWRPADRRVDNWLTVYEAPPPDARVRALPLQRVAMPRAAALAPDSRLLSALVVVPESSLSIGSDTIVIDRKGGASYADHALIVPVAYDPAWIASSGEVLSVGGLLAVRNASEQHTTVRYVPDAVAVLRASGMIAMQLLTGVGALILGLTRVKPAEQPALDLYRRRVRHGTTVVAIRAWRRAAPAIDPIVAPLKPELTRVRTWLYVAYCVSVTATLDWRPEDPGETSARVALLVPAAAFAVAAIGRWAPARSITGVLIFGAAVGAALAGGSRAVAAFNDPLFWAVVAVGAAAASGVGGRWRTVGSGAAALGGMAAMVAVLLPTFSNFETAWPSLSTFVVRDSIATVTQRLGAIPAVLLVQLWLQAIVAGSREWARDGRTAPAAAGALGAALLLWLAGASPDADSTAAALLVLGVLMGLADQPLFSLRSPICRNNLGIEEGTKSPRSTA